MYTLNNDELAEAIIVAFDNSAFAGNQYPINNPERAKLMLEHLKGLLQEQLKRANYESCTHVS